jgi:cytochrome b subunit of formate dehydrogenase
MGTPSSHEHSPLTREDRHVNIRHQITAVLSIATFVSILTSPGLAQDPESPGGDAPETCIDCHDGQVEPGPLGPPHRVLLDSVHADSDCIDCHISLSMEDVDIDADLPHGEGVEPVDCGECHMDEVEEYTHHGRMAIGSAPDLPGCSSCHGTHDILAVEDQESRVHPINLPTTCRACHANAEVLQHHEFLRDGPIRLYESSVHGKTSVKGMYVAATCNDCHCATGEDGRRTAHQILPPSDPESTIHHFNIPDTCGQCHESIAKDYWAGIHGKMVKRGQVDSPVCTDCHGEHGILSPSDPNSSCNSANIAQKTCSPCHDSDVLNEKYGVPGGRFSSWVDSYHGLKSKAGDVKVAHCASCHGAHRILPRRDPSSSVHPENLPETCGECHPGITDEIAMTAIHATATGHNKGWPAFFRNLYLIIIVVTIGGMLLHNAADLLRHLKVMRGESFVLRLTPNETAQHWLLMISFVVLALSGFSLRFSEAWWVKMTFGWGGGEGFLFRGMVHRVAAVLFIICCVWHAGYLLTARGRQAVLDMWPRKRDLIDVKDNLLYFLGMRSKRPRFGRFSYVEKLEYWALVWGGILMSVTGLMLWFDNYLVENGLLPKGVLDVLLVIHYYEAWLASLAIFLWHGYSVVYGPTVYPMNPAWVSGKMPKEMYEHEHPEGPRLKGRIQRVFDEEESGDGPSAEA